MACGLTYFISEITPPLPVTLIGNFLDLSLFFAKAPLSRGYYLIFFGIKRAYVGNYGNFFNQDVILSTCL